MSAVDREKTQEVKQLLDAGAYPDTADSKRRTPLYRAAFRGHLHVVRLLLDAGADPEATEDRGKTAEMIAEERGYDDVVSLFRANRSRNSVLDALGAGKLRQ